MQAAQAVLKQTTTSDVSSPPFKETAAPNFWQKLPKHPGPEPPGSRTCGMFYQRLHALNPGNTDSADFHCHFLKSSGFRRMLSANLNDMNLSRMK